MIKHPKLTRECPIKLLPHQVDHCMKIWKLLVDQQVFSYMDTSETGAGKTIASLWIAWHLQEIYGIKTAIIAPSDISLTNDDGWLYHSEEHGINIAFTSTYASLRGGKGVVSHPWLIPNPDDKKDWVASEEFHELCRRGTFLIFDECHKSKNSSISHFAAAALIKAAKEHRKGCRVALLSHTPGDKVEVIPQLLRMTGLITSKKLFKNEAFTSNYQIEGYGLGELARVCKRLAPQDSKEIDRRMQKLNKKESLKICYEMYTKYIRNVITFAMPKPQKGFNVTLRNAFLETDEESLNLVQEGIRSLSRAVQWNEEIQEVGEKSTWSLGDITLSLKKIELGKIGIIARYVNEECKKNPNQKYVLVCGEFSTENQYLLQEMIKKEKTVDDFKDILIELRNKSPLWKSLPKDIFNYMGKFISDVSKPHVINGGVSVKKRREIVKDFQSTSMDTWCLIISPGTGAESISLHDKNGGNPRNMCIIPSYYFERVHQAAGRVNRVGMMSDAKVNIIYSKEASVETKILHSMITKSIVARDLIAQGQQVVYPGEFPFYIEGERKPELEQELMAMRPY